MFIPLNSLCNSDEINLCIRNTTCFSPSDDTTVPTIPELMRDVASQIPTKWESVGIQLNLPRDTLDNFKDLEPNAHFV